MLSRIQIFSDCPDEWENNGVYCYKFVGDLPLKYDDAARACGVSSLSSFILLVKYVGGDEDDGGDDEVRPSMWC